MFKAYLPDRTDSIGLFARLDKGQLSMFMAVHLGLKPLMDTFLTMENFLTLKEKCRGEGILVDHNGIMTTIPSDDFLRKKERVRRLGTTKMIAMPYNEDQKDALVHTFISRDKSMIDMAQRLTWYNLFSGEYQLLQPKIDNFRYGAVLGFPECCCRFYAGHNGGFGEGEEVWSWNTPLEVSKNSTEPYSFYCNHIPMDHTFFLIHHYPCHYNCSETIKMASGLLRGIREIEPEFAGLIEEKLKLPYLLFDEKIAFAFEGEIRKDEIHYRKAAFLGEPREMAPYSIIMEGNHLKIDRGYLEIFRDGTLIGRHQAEGRYGGRIYRFA